MLLQRAQVEPADVIERLVGMQAQEPLDPYFGLWSRLEGFEPSQLADLILSRVVVRSPLMRTTIHLVTADDALTLYPLMRPVLVKALKNTPFGKGTAGVDLPALEAAGRVILEEQPRTTTELGKLLHQQWPEYDPKHLAYVIHYRLPLVQVPPRAIWGQRGQATWTTIEAWLGRPIDPGPTPDEIVLRYLAAFGPAATADVRTWSGLTGLREVMARLRPRLRTYRDERGRELFDVQDGTFVAPDTPAPPRFLPQFDNVSLSHADRVRIISEEHRKRLLTANGVGPGTFLINGFVAGTWRLETSKASVTLRVQPFEPPAAGDRDALAAEAERLLAFAAPDVGDWQIEFNDPK